MPTVYQQPVEFHPIDKSEYKSLLENDHKSDISFECYDETEKTILRIPAHSEILFQANNKIMNQILSDMSTMRRFRVKENSRGFKNLLRMFYEQPVKISSMNVALASLQTAINFKCPDLADISARKVDCFLASDNVLIVLKTIGFSNDITNNVDINRILDNLRKNCYIFIDIDPKPVLKNEEIVYLTRDQLGLILSRNSLQNIKETECWDCLDQWASFQCQRSCSGSMHEKKYEILRDTSKMVRYSLMKKRDYIAGPGRFFTVDENDEIFRQMKNNEKLPRDAEVEKMIPMSERSMTKNKNKIKIKKIKRNSDEDLSSCLLCFLHGFACVFD